MPRKSTVHAVTAIGIDMGKNTLHMVGLDSRGAIVLREKVSRGRIASRLANLPPCLIGIEAGILCARRSGFGCCAAARDHVAASVCLAQGGAGRPVGAAGGCGTHVRAGDDRAAGS